jgi:predicted DNA-binding transcriptional regulator YafY
VDLVFPSFSMDKERLLMYPQRGGSLSQAQRERLTYLEFRLYFMGEIGRPDLSARFGVAPAGATRDIAMYRELAPKNIDFHNSSKTYRISSEFVPIFEHAPQRVLSALSLGFGDGVDCDPRPLLPCEFPAVLNCPRMDVLAPICRAIHAKRPVAIRYQSMSSGASERVIVPFALVDTGLRWHVRAFDRKSEEFRDFVITRIQNPTALDDEPMVHELMDADIQWTRIVELDLVPHPSISRPEIVQMDYAMQDGALRIRVRAAVAGYMLLRWGVDASQDHSLHGHEYRLWLKDHLALYGVKNAVLAPGYTVTSKADS